jgi:hypothetical protein
MTETIDDGVRACQCGAAWVWPAIDWDGGEGDTESVTSCLNPGCLDVAPPPLYRCVRCQQPVAEYDGTWVITGSGNSFFDGEAACSLLDENGLSYYYDETTDCWRDLGYGPHEPGEALG